LRFIFSMPVFRGELFGIVLFNAESKNSWHTTQPTVQCIKAVLISQQRNQSN
jgi:hypothetical protein